MRKLAETPGLGHLREDLADPRHRFLLVYSYLVVYRPKTKPLEVIRVLPQPVMSGHCWASVLGNHDCPLVYV